MAGNYPSHNQLLGSRRVPDNSGIVDDVAQGGTQHSRQYHSQQYYFFTLVHFLTQAEFDALMTDYLANPRTTRTLTWAPEDSTSPETTYTVKYQSAPVQVSKENADGWFVTVRLRGYKD